MKFVKNKKWYCLVCSHCGAQSVAWLVNQKKLVCYLRFWKYPQTWVELGLISLSGCSLWCGLSSLQFDVKLKTYSVLYTLLRNVHPATPAKEGFVKLKWNESQKCKQKHAVRYDSFLLIKICEKQKKYCLVWSHLWSRICKTGVKLKIHWCHYIIASSLFYYINGHCFKFATSHKKIAPSMPT